MLKGIAFGHKSSTRRVSVTPLVPGEYDLITHGRGIPKDGLPKRCLLCGRLIRSGEMWRSHDNGQYKTIEHRVCK